MIVKIRTKGMRLFLPVPVKFMGLAMRWMPERIMEDTGAIWRPGYKRSYPYGAGRMPGCDQRKQGPGSNPCGDRGRHIFIS